MQSWLLSALRFFELIDETGRPTNYLKETVAVDEGQRSQTLGICIRRGYPEFFLDNFELGTATLGQLEQAFRERGASGSTVMKCVQFFTALAEEAGLELSPHIRNAKPTRSRAKSSTTPKRRKIKRQASTTATVGSDTDPAVTADDILSNRLFRGLVDHLPAPGSEFSEEDRKKWFDAVRLCFDLIFQHPSEDND